MFTCENYVVSLTKSRIATPCNRTPRSQQHIAFLLSHSRTFVYALFLSLSLYVYVCVCMWDVVHPRCLIFLCWAKALAVVCFRSQA